MTAVYKIGDVHETLATLEPGSVDLIVGSPPFLALRSYLPVGHPDKAKEIGSEATPGEFIDTMLDVVEACARILAPHGSLVFELGDTYAGGGGGGENGEWGRYAASDGERKGSQGPSTAKLIRRSTSGWPDDKSKVLIPQLFAIALSYGFNPLTGRTTPQWRVRNTVAWCRPNPPVGRDGDKFRSATSFLTIACKARDRYWDGDAVRTTLKVPEAVDVEWGGIARTSANGRYRPGEPVPSNPAGAPLLDWWEIPTAPYGGSHYATYPPDLIVPIVKAMCPQRVCRVCGQPSRRITATFTLDSYRSATRPQTIRAVALADEHGLTDEHIAAVRAFGTSDAGKAPVLNNGHGHNTAEVERLAAEAKAVLGGYFREFVMGTNAARVSSWSDCEHGNWRPGHVLDPFAGTGVTGLVATGHGHDCTLIDIDARNAELALERVGPMLLTVETLSGVQGDT